MGFLCIISQASFTSRTPVSQRAATPRSDARKFRLSAQATSSSSVQGLPVIYIYVYVSIYLSIYLYIYLSIYLFIYLSVYLSIYLSI